MGSMIRQPLFISRQASKAEIEGVNDICGKIKISVLTTIASMAMKITTTVATKPTTLTATTMI